MISTTSKFNTSPSLQVHLQEYVNISNRILHDPTDSASLIERFSNTSRGIDFICN